MNSSDGKGGPVLGVDYGLKRVGLAVSDPERRVAVGAGRLEGLSGRALARAIAAAARSRKAGVIVVGAPPAGSRGHDEVAAGASKLAAALARMGFEVVRCDESYTTAEALAAGRRFGGKLTSTKGWVDEAAAVLILQGYLDRQRMVGVDISEVKSDADA